MYLIHRAVLPSPPTSFLPSITVKLQANSILPGIQCGPNMFLTLVHPLRLQPSTV
jgi:hypothetical protein